MLKRVGQTEMEKNHVTPEGAMIRIMRPIRHHFIRDWSLTLRFMETGILYTPEC